MEIVNYFNSRMSKDITSLRRAYCTKCKTDNESNRIFLVSPDADVCYCPNCMHKLKPKEAIDEYNLFIQQKVNRANRLLFQETRFYEAYVSFAHIIEIDPQSEKARYGRLLSLVYMSTLRKTQFISAATLLKKEADQYFHKVKDQSSYMKFLFRLDRALTEYKKRFIKKITIKDRFYSEDCANLYFLRIHELTELKRVILDELTRTNNHLQDERSFRLTKEVQKSYDSLFDLINEKVTTTNGYRYKVAKIMNNRQILMTRLDIAESPISHFIRYKLDENEKKGRLISDKVFPDNTGIAIFLKIALPLSIFFILAGVGFSVSHLFIEEWMKIYFLFTFIAAFAIGAILAVLYMIWKIKLTKRRHLID